MSGQICHLLSLSDHLAAVWMLYVGRDALGKLESIEHFIVLSSWSPKHCKLWVPSHRGLTQISDWLVTLISFASPLFCISCMLVTIVNQRFCG